MTKILVTLVTAGRTAEDDNIGCLPIGTETRPRPEWKFIMASNRNSEAGNLKFGELIQ